MALATKCPQCGALFRVVADQLKLRGGLVRCGQCRAVFDAIGSLTYLDDAALAQSRQVQPAGKEPESESAPPPAPDDSSGGRHTLGPATTLRISPIAPATLAGNMPPRIELPKPPPEEPALVRRRARAAARASAEARMLPETEPADARVPTLLASNEMREPAAAEQPQGVEVVEPAAAPPEPEADESAATQPLPRFARPKRGPARRFSIVFGGGSALLAALAIVQLAVIFRSELLVHWPQSRPALVELCGVFRCTVGWPTQADQLAVLGTELQAIAGTGAFELTAVVRNRAGFRQALPAIEVTLTDARNRALARKVFSPVDYLASAGEASARLQEGLAPGADVTIRVFFEARGLAPAGFLVYPFYL